MEGKEDRKKQRPVYLLFQSSNLPTDMEIKNINLILKLA